MANNKKRFGIKDGVIMAVVAVFLFLVIWGLSPQEADEPASSLSEKLELPAEGEQLDSQDYGSNIKICPPMDVAPGESIDCVAEFLSFCPVGNSVLLRGTQVDRLMILRIQKDDESFCEISFFDDGGLLKRCSIPLKTLLVGDMDSRLEAAKAAAEGTQYCG